MAPSSQLAFADRTARDLLEIVKRSDSHAYLEEYLNFLDGIRSRYEFLRGEMNRLFEVSPAESFWSDVDKASRVSPSVTEASSAVSKWSSE